jgi:hypothetical protein
LIDFLNKVGKSNIVDRDLNGDEDYKDSSSTLKDDFLDKEGLMLCKFNNFFFLQ